LQVSLIGTMTRISRSRPEPLCCTGYNPMA
jgi:hypothetical protein